MSQENDLALDRLLRLKSEIDAKLIELARIQGDSEFVREVAFVAEFKALKQKYQFTSSDAFAILDPARSFGGDLDLDQFFEALQAITCQENPVPATPKGRNLMRYRNPFTGEVIETKGTNNKKLREWKSSHGRELVEAWREI
jgi:hypothetical protein